MTIQNQNLIIEGVLGPHEVGVMFAIFLFGLVTIQTFSYYQNYPRDAMGIKVMVGSVWVLTLAHTSIISYSLYQRTVMEFGQMSLLEKYPEGICWSFNISAVLGVVIQSFFAYRLGRLSRSLIIPTICWTLSLFRLGAVTTITVVTCRIKTIQDNINQWKWLGNMTLSVSAFVDVMISVSLCYYLWLRRSEVFKHSKKVIDRLIIWSIHTGALTGIFSTAVLALSVTATNYSWLGAYLPIPGLFSNYLLASLNARQSLRDDMQLGATLLDLPPMHTSSRTHSSDRRSVAVDANVTEVLFSRTVDEPELPSKDKKPQDVELGPSEHSRSSD